MALRGLSPPAEASADLFEGAKFSSDVSLTVCFAFAPKLVWLQLSLCGHALFCYRPIQPGQRPGQPATAPMRCCYSLSLAPSLAPEVMSNRTFLDNCDSKHFCYSALTNYFWKPSKNWKSISKRMSWVIETCESWIYSGRPVAKFPNGPARIFTLEIAR